jgi:hypothetical protein
VNIGSGLLASLGQMPTGVGGPLSKSSLAKLDESLPNVAGM